MPPIAYGLATLTGLSRIYGNSHWASDAFFGAALGYFVGRTVVRLHDGNVAGNIAIVPEMGSRYSGLSVQFSY